MGDTFNRLANWKKSMWHFSTDQVTKPAPVAVVPDVPKIDPAELKRQAQEIADAQARAAAEQLAEAQAKAKEAADALAREQAEAEAAEKLKQAAERAQHAAEQAERARIVAAQRELGPGNDFRGRDFEKSAYEQPGFKDTPIRTTVEPQSSLPPTTSVNGSAANVNASPTPSTANTQGNLSPRFRTAPIDLEAETRPFISAPIDLEVSAGLAPGN